MSEKRLLPKGPAERDSARTAQPGAWPASPETWRSVRVESSASRSMRYRLATPHPSWGGCHHRPPSADPVPIRLPGSARHAQALTPWPCRCRCNRFQDRWRTTRVRTPGPVVPTSKSWGCESPRMSERRRPDHRLGSSGIGPDAAHPSAPDRHRAPMSATVHARHLRPAAHSPGSMDAAAPDHARPSSQRLRSASPRCLRAFCRA